MQGQTYRQSGKSLWADKLSFLFYQTGPNRLRSAAEKAWQSDMMRIKYGEPIRGLTLVDRYATSIINAVTAIIKCPL